MFSSPKKAHVIVRRHAPNDPTLLSAEELEEVWAALNNSDLTLKELYVATVEEEEVI